MYVPRRQSFEVQRDAATLEGLDIESVLAVLPVGQLVLVARELVAVIIDVNEARQRSGAEPIFKITQRVVRVSAELPFALVVDHRTFGEFIDDLYWLLYEAAGSGSLRYLIAKGGPLRDDQCDIVFVIKRLRNHIRHDPEHGSPREIEKKFEAVRGDLRKRGFDALPRTRDGYSRLQRVLLEESAAFVRPIHDGL